MNIHVRTTNQQISPALVEYVRNRLDTALDRFRHRVRGVFVRLGDVNGPRGGMGQSCRLSIDMIGSGDVYIEQVGVDPYATVDLATDRAKRTVARRLRRWRLSPRRSSDAIGLA